MLNAEALRDNTPGLVNLSNYRRNLVLSNPNDIKQRTPYVEELLEKNKSLTLKVGSILSKKNRVELH